MLEFCVEDKASKKVSVINHTGHGRGHPVKPNRQRGTYRVMMIVVRLVDKVGHVRRGQFEFTSQKVTKLNCPEVVALLKAVRVFVVLICEQVGTLDERVLHIGLGKVLFDLKVGDRLIVCNT